MLEAGYLDTAKTIGDTQEDIEEENNNTSDTNGDNRDHVKIYVITPTYWRPEQEAELTRIGQTLVLVAIQVLNLIIFIKIWY